MHLVKMYLPLMKMPTSLEHTSFLPTTFDKNPFKYLLDRRLGPGSPVWNPGISATCTLWLVISAAFCLPILVWTCRGPTCTLWPMHVSSRGVWAPGGRVGGSDPWSPLRDGQGSGWACQLASINAFFAWMHVPESGAGSRGALLIASSYIN